MPFRLHCLYCGTHFALDADSPAAGALRRMADEGPWAALGDGATLEDEVFIELRGREPRCPACTAPVPVSHASLAQFTQVLLAGW